MEEKSISVIIQAGSNYQLVKEPRIYVFPILLTVGDGGSEDHLEIE